MKRNFTKLVDIYFGQILQFLRFFFLKSLPLFGRKEGWFLIFFCKKNQKRSLGFSKQFLLLPPKKNRPFSLQLPLSLFCALFFTFFTEGGVLHAQQAGNMTLFMYNPVIFNPAAAGAGELPSITLHHRSQWIGLKGAPQQQALTYSGNPFSKRLGMGITFQNRRVGIFETQTGVLALSYSPIQTKKMSIRIGLQGSLRRYGFHFNELEETNQLFNDKSISRDFENIWTGNVGMGIYATYEQAYFGIGIPFFVTNLLGINELSTTTAVEYRHAYAIGGLTLPITEGVNLKPAALIKYAQNAPWNLETNMNLSVKEKVILGISYRVGKTNGSQLGESVGFVTVVQASERLALGVAYDWILSRLGQYTSGSGEVVLRYQLKEKEVKLSNPRGSDF